MEFLNFAYTFMCRCNGGVQELDGFVCHNSNENKQCIVVVLYWSANISISNKIFFWHQYLNKDEEREEGWNLDRLLVVKLSGVVDMGNMGQVSEVRILVGEKMIAGNIVALYTLYTLNTLKHLICLRPRENDSKKMILNWQRKYYFMSKDWNIQRFPKYVKWT